MITSKIGLIWYIDLLNFEIWKKKLTQKGHNTEKQIKKNNLEKNIECIVRISAS